MVTRRGDKCPADDNGRDVLDSGALNTCAGDASRFRKRRAYVIDEFGRVQTAKNTTSRPAVGPQSVEMLRAESATFGQLFEEYLQE